MCDVAGHFLQGMIEARSHACEITSDLPCPAGSSIINNNGGVPSSTSGGSGIVNNNNNGGGFTNNNNNGGGGFLFSLHVICRSASA